MSAYQGWERGECRIVTTQAPEDGEPVLAWFSAEAPGLAVIRNDDERDGFFGVTHVASGRAIAKGFIALTDAKKAALRLAPLTDWTRSRNELFAAKGLGGKVREVLTGVAP